MNQCCQNCEYYAWDRQESCMSGDGGWRYAHVCKASRTGTDPITGKPFYSKAGGLFINSSNCNNFTQKRSFLERLKYAFFG